MKRLLATVLILLAAGSLVAVSSLPSCDARYLNLSITYTLNSDGSWEMEYHHRVKLNTYYAVNRDMGETFIVYNPDFQKLEILKSETTMADGRTVSSPENAFNEVLPFAAHGFADFAGLREMVITHIGLERGAEVELQYRLHTRVGFLPVFSGLEEMSRDYPVDQYQLTVNVPASRELYYKSFGMDVPAESVRSDSGKSVVFRLHNLQPSSREPLRHPQSNPFIVFSVANSWEQAMPLENDAAPLPEPLVRRIKALAGRNLLRSDLLLDLQKISAEEIQNCLLGIGETGWRPRPGERVVSSNYGTNLEKARMLVQILKEAGIASELLAVAGDAFASEVAAPQQTREFWLKVLPDPAGNDGNGDRTVFYLDPCHPHNGLFPYSVHGWNAWNLDRRELEKMPSTDSSANGIDISGALTVSSDGVSGTLRVEAKGLFHHYEEASNDGRSFIEGLLRKYFPVEKVEMKKLLKLTRDEICVEAECSGKWLKPCGDGPGTAKFFTADSIRLPMLQEGMVQPTVRRSSLSLEVPFETSVKLALQLEDSLQPEFIPADVNQANELGHFSRSLTRGENGTMDLSITCGVSRSMIGPEAYPKLRRVLLPYFDSEPWLLLKKN